MRGWEMSESLRNLSTIEYGASPKEIRASDYTDIGIYGTGGLVGSATKPLFHGPLVVVAKKGTLDKPLFIIGDCWVIDTAYAVLPNANVDAKWLYYNLLKYDLKKLNESTGVPSISRDYLYRVTFETFPLPEQRKIARILSTVDAVIEKTEAAIAKYKVIKSGMMRDLFTRGIDLKTGKLRPRYEDAPELYKQSELGWVPEEWEVEILEEMAEITTGSTPPTSNTWNYGDDYMFVSPSDINENQFIQSTEKMLSIAGFLLCRKLPAKSICVVCIGSTIGKMAFTVRECATNQQINAVVPRNTNLTDFLYYAMLFYNGEQFRKETGLQAVPIVNKSNFSKFLLPLVEENEAISIAKKLFAIDIQLQTEFANTHKYQQLKFALMSDLLTGKVRVKVSEP